MIRTIVMTLALVAAFTFSAQAQGPGGQRGPRPERAPMSEEQMQERLEKVAAKLELSENQKASFLNIETEHREKLMALRDNEEYDRTEKRELMQQYKEEKENQLKVALGEEKFEAYETLRKEQMTKRQGRGRRMGGNNQ